MRLQIKKNNSTFSFFTFFSNCTNFTNKERDSREKNKQLSFIAAKSGYVAAEKIRF